jgi:hypothetical protein
VIIVLVAFPLFAHVLFGVTRLLLGLIQPSLPPLTEAASDIFRQGSVGAAVVVGVLGSFRICRRLWPTPVIKKAGESAR